MDKPQNRGLTSKEAAVGLKTYGYNAIKDVSTATPLKILLRQIQSNFIVYLLIAATIISFWVGKSVTAITILVIIFIIIVVGFIQEFRAEKAISALKGMLVPVTIVLRDNREQEIDSREIVPGDVLILRNGEKVPADCLIIEEKELRVNESVLTGESKEIRKAPGTQNQHTDDTMIFMGTYIVNGKCVAQAVHTGMNTKFGKIAGLISSVEKELPLQNKVNRIIKRMVILGITISVLTGLIILYRSASISEDVLINTLILAIAISVSAFPESFPVVLITTLAFGARKMAKENAIVNRMSIIETLGETTVICSDKTGTITKGEMTVRRVFAGGEYFDVSGSGYDASGGFFHNGKQINPGTHGVLNTLINCSVLCNDASIERTGTDNEYKTIGSPTESALLIMAAKALTFKEDLPSNRLEEIPFNSDRKMMTVLCQIDRQKMVFMKGAPEFIIERCRFIQKKNMVYRMTKKDRTALLEHNEKLTTAALRTVAFAYKNTKATVDLEDDLVFLGFAGMEDPPREEVKEAIEMCHKAGIDVKMITGDSRDTALAISNEIGLRGNIMEGNELDDASDEELSILIKSVSIFARVKPEHKMRIIAALKANGEIVTMTGDGVNDAPALKEAHIGIAMGKNGTDVSRSVADLTLKDDNFKTIVSAIREGRAIFKNIRKFTTYQLSCNFAELSVLFLGVLLAPTFGWGIPLFLALQILFMNMVTADLPAIALGLNHASTDSMHDPPRKDSEILSSRFIGVVVFTGLVLTGIVLGAYYLSFNVFGASQEYARTVALFTLIGLEIAAAFNFRSFRKGTFNRSLVVNPYLFIASVVSLIATFGIIYTPLNKVFETVPIGLDAFVIAIASSLVFLLIFDLLKYINKKRRFVNLDHL